MKGKLYIIITLCILLSISFVSAFEFDNSKTYNPETKTATIKNAFGLGSEIAKLQLIWNTPNCGGDMLCSAIIKADLKESSVNPFSSISFKSLKDLKYKDINHNLQISSDGINYKPYDTKESLNGNYYFKITGTKASDEVIDWVGTFYGLDLTEWAVWGTQYTYDDFNDASINFTLWQNTSLLTGASPVDTGMNEGTTQTGALTVWAGKNADCTAKDFARSGVSSLLFPNINAIHNITIGAVLNTSLAGCASLKSEVSASLSLFGNNTFTYPGIVGADKSEWYLLRNYSALVTTFSVYNDGVYYGQLVPTNNKINISAEASNGGGAGGMAFAALDYVYYSYSQPSFELYYNSTTYEMANEGYTLNVSYDTSSLDSLDSAYFNFNGTRTSATIIPEGVGQALAIASTAIPISTGLKNIIFETFLTNSSGTFNYNYTTTQLVNATNLTYCPNGVGVEYINFTFQDEVTSTAINGTLTSANWVYYLSSISLNKTLSFTSTSVDNRSYAFCLSPQHLSLNYLVDTRYSYSGYPQRTKALTGILTNVTTNVILSLLSSTDGIYSQFQVVDNVNGSSLSGVYVTATRNSEIITSGYTDDSGVITLWLNPDFTYSMSFSKTGYNTLTSSITPTNTDVYTVTLESTTGTATQPSYNYTNITAVNFSYSPPQGFLINDTEYNFNFNITSSDSISVYVNITNLSQTLFTNSYVGTSFNINQVLNTGSNTTILALVTFESSTEIYTYTLIWNAGDFSPGDFSLWSWLLEWNNQSDGSNLFLWLQGIIVLSCVIAVGYGFYTGAGGDSIDSALAAIGGISLVIWLFSLAGWLTISTIPNAWMAKYTIALLITLFGAGFAVWRFTER